MVKKERQDMLLKHLEDKYWPGDEDVWQPFS
jgi:hypothetical protein